MANRNDFQSVLREELANQAGAAGSVQQRHEAAVVRTVRRLGLSFSDAMRAITTGQLPHDPRQTERANLAEMSAARNGMNTNLRDLAHRMAGRAEAEGRDVAAEIAAARNPQASAAVAKANEDRAAVANMTFSEALRHLMARGSGAPVNSPAPLAPATNASLNPTRAPMTVAKGKATTLPTTKPVVRKAAAPVRKADTRLRKAEVDALRNEIDLAINEMPHRGSQLVALRMQLDAVVRARGLRD